MQEHPQGVGHGRKTDKSATTTHRRLYALWVLAAIIRTAPTCAIGLRADALPSNGQSGINALNQEIDRLESRLLEGVKLRPEYAWLKRIPGIGEVRQAVSGFRDRYNRH